jgi:hypothetical protein
LPRHRLALRLRDESQITVKVRYRQRGSNEVFGMVDGGREGQRRGSSEGRHRLARRVAVGRGGSADILGSRLCSEALAMTRAICSWPALSCSAAAGATPSRAV